MTTSSDRVEALGRSLAAWVLEKGIVARCELLHRIYQEVRIGGLDAQDLRTLEAMVGGRRIAPGIFASIVGGHPIFPGFPKLDSFTVIEGRIFHFSKEADPSVEDFRGAYQDFRLRREEILRMMVANLEKIITLFMSEAGYRLLEKDLQGMQFIKEGGSEVLTLLAYSRIANLELQECLDCARGHPESCVAVVPHEESLPPFVAFFKDHHEAFEEAGIQVWVANMEEGSVDPFIGFTTDPDIYSAFKNPRLASMVRTTWAKR